ncbi:MAG: prolyl oligopeptidase family serine peptidase [Polyangia bacterium]
MIRTVAPVMMAAVTLSAALALGAAPPSADVGRLRSDAVSAIARARVAADKSDVLREVTLPSIERLVEDADLRRANVTLKDRDEAFVRDTLKTARAYADRVAAGQDPYRNATGVMVKAYRADWDGTLQPYALYVPRNFDPAKRWPLIVALHGAYSNPLHNLRRVFGLDNRPGETDAEAARNPLPLPDVPALVVSPFGRGELMGYDGLGGDDVMRVIADVRRAYNIDPERMTLTGLSMGGGGTWAIGLRHPEMFAALAPVCAMSDFVWTIPPSELPFYDIARLQALSPPAIAENAAHMQVMIFHGSDDPTVPVEDSRRMAARYRALGWLGKNVSYTEYPGVKHDAWIPAYKDAALLRKLAGVRRDPAAPKAPLSPPPPGQAVPGLFGKSVPRQHPHLYVYGTHGAAAAVAAARALAQALADWGPMVAARFTVKADRDVTAAERARFDLVLVGAASFNALAPAVTTAPIPLGDRAFRAQVADAAAPSKFVLVFGAATPGGFARLRRFAVPNREHFAPESNRTFVEVP